MYLVITIFVMSITGSEIYLKLKTNKLKLVYGEIRTAYVAPLQIVDTGKMHLDLYPILKETNTNSV